MLRQVLHLARQVTTDAWLQRRVLSEAMLHLAKADMDRTPAEILPEVEQLAHKALGTHDPFAETRRAMIGEAQALEAQVRAQIERSDDRLRAALEAALGANVCDALVFGPVALEQSLAQVHRDGFALDEYAELQADLAGATTVLYVCDTAPELVFDALVLEELERLGKQVVCAVQRQRVLNEAVREDAEALGLTDRFTVIETGGDGMGAPLALTSSEFKAAYQAADLVIAKGSANLETLEEADGARYFLLRVKCEVVARHLGVERGAAVLQRG